MMNVNAGVDLLVPAGNFSGALIYRPWGVHKLKEYFDSRIAEWLETHLLEPNLPFLPVEKVRIARYRDRWREFQAIMDANTFPFGPHYAMLREFDYQHPLFASSRIALFVERDYIICQIRDDQFHFQQLVFGPNKNLDMKLLFVYNYGDPEELVTLLTIFKETNQTHIDAFKRQPAEKKYRDERLTWFKKEALQFERARTNYDVYLGNSAQAQKARDEQQQEFLRLCRERDAFDRECRKRKEVEAEPEAEPAREKKVKLDPRSPAMRVVRTQLLGVSGGDWAFDRH